MSLTVLHLAANRWWTGSADPVIQLASGLRARGHRVLLGVIPGDRFEAKAREAGFDIVPGLDLQARFQPFAFMRDVRRLSKVVAREGVDVIHCHHSHDHWLGMLIRDAHDDRLVPVVRTFHAFRAVKSGGRARWLHGRTAGVFAVSGQIEARCRDVGIPAGRVFRVPGVTDLPRFAGDVDLRPIRDELKLGTAPVIVSVARLAHNRGHEILLSAFRMLLEKFPEARLLLVGKGEARPRLEALVATTGLSERVIFTGYRDGDLPAVLAAADCFVLMAAGSDESCRAALEAMAAGRPVGGRAGGALAGTIRPGETGLLVDDDRPESVMLALAAILGDPERARAMGLAGRRRAEREFVPERAVSVVEDVYRSLP